MGNRITKNFQKRFGNPPRIKITPVSLRREDRKLHNERVFGAYKQVLTSLLKRPPTEAELLGFVDIEKEIKKASSDYD